MAKIIGLCWHPVVWDGRGFYRRDPNGRRLVVFSDRSPFPDHSGCVGYGVAETAEEARFIEGESPWVAYAVEDAFAYGNGVAIEQAVTY